MLWVTVEQDRQGEARSRSLFRQKGLGRVPGCGQPMRCGQEVVSRRIKRVLPRKGTNDVSMPRKYLKHCSSVWFSILCLPMGEIGRLWSDEDRHLEV